MSGYQAYACSRRESICRLLSQEGNKRARFVKIYAAKELINVLTQPFATAIIIYNYIRVFK
jgi:hypothetical protein